MSETLPPDPWARSEAEHKAAALHNLGWEVGAGATIWARVVADVLALHDSARGELAAGTANLETWERLQRSRSSSRSSRSSASRSACEG